MNTINKNASVIFNLLLNAGFNERFASWITCQSAHETANFSSYIYRTNLNAFGMKYMGQKTARGEKNGYAYYENYSESVADYRRLYKSYGIVIASTVESFVKLLKDRRYFEAATEAYLAGMNHFLKLYFPDGKLAEAAKISGAGGTW